jgi:hypothetical protein
MTDDLRYPVGNYSFDTLVDEADYPKLIETIAAAPKVLRDAVKGMSEEQLDTPYRDGGWTVRQVVHHLGDSHMNAFCRLKLALTEDAPTIKPYDEAAWAELADARLPVEVTLQLLESLHERWVAIWKSIPTADFKKRGYVHPEHKRFIPLDLVLGMYAWHCQHHTAHITGLATRNGW